MLKGVKPETSRGRDAEACRTSTRYSSVASDRNESNVHC